MVRASAANDRLVPFAPGKGPCATRVRFIMGSRKPVEIAPGVHWYSAGAVAGNIYFVQSASSWVLIDTATAGQGRRIREAAEALFGGAPAPPQFCSRTFTPITPDLRSSWRGPGIVRSISIRTRWSSRSRGISQPWRAMPIRSIAGSSSRCCACFRTVDRGDDGEGEPQRSGADIRARGGSAGTARMDEHHHARPLAWAHCLLPARRSRVDLRRRPADSRRWLARGRIVVGLASQQAAGLRTAMVHKLGSQQDDGFRQRRRPPAAASPGAWARPPTVRRRGRLRAWRLRA